MASNLFERDVTMAKRVEIVGKLEAGVDLNELAKEYGLSRRTIQRYRQNAASIKQFSENPKNMDRKRQRGSLFEDLNKRLYSWCVEKRLLHNCITDRHLQEKARELYEEFGGPSNFTANRGWLWRFKNKYDIARLVNINGDPAMTNEAVAHVFARDLNRLLAKEEIAEENLYNMDETILFWKTLPRKALACKVKNQTEGMNRCKKDRVTVAFCANSTGTHKLPLLFVHKYENPRALKYYKHSLSVSFRSQANGRVDEDTFRQWYVNDFKQSVRQHQLQHHRMGKVLLVVDGVSGHRLNDEELDDGYFKVMFLPSTAATLIQPMEQGIITGCKNLFRYALLRRVLKYDGLSQFYTNYNMKDCIDLITDVWNSVTPENVYNSWRKLLNRPPTTAIVTKQDSEYIMQSEFSSISAEDVAQWISECEGEEDGDEEGDEEQKEQEEEKETIEEKFVKEEIIEEETTMDDVVAPPSPIEYEEVNRTLNTLQKMALTEPEIQVHIEAILKHFRKKFNE